MRWPSRCLVAAAVAVGALVSMGAMAAGTPASSLQRRIAITIDDLPWATMGDETPATLAEFHPRLVAAMKDAGVPVIGFVNEGKLVSEGKVETSRVHLLKDWLDAGLNLGNHSYSHADLHAVGLEVYESDILRGEVFLRPLLAEHDKKPEWFRHPYLRAGRTPGDKAALKAFLADHGYKIAPVTVDTSDWVWAAAYRKALAAGDTAALGKLREDYVAYMVSKVDYFESQSILLLGYNLPQILLMHANEINADCYGKLIDGIRGRGYDFITLETAMQDPAYQRDDAYLGKWGPSWIHRWAIGESKPSEFFAGEPKVSAWVMTLAEIDSE